MSTVTTPCPCGSGRPLDECCGRFHAGQPAPTPEALMRSRYSAFALGRVDYLLATWHPDTRPAELSPDDATTWLRLEVRSSSAQGDEGQVHFRATFREGRRFGVLEEASRFLRLAGAWYYLDGQPTVSRLKPGRNDPCVCGSGRKFKQCCGTR
ncbi:YchJ family protein [Halomonas sp. G15]|uniref:YchJ family protein n=1 Tax=Halomonas sp. G15 TaxID=2903521 RepID=UPI001E4CC644|nr:YchJ family protein [Halomonas sp. G15]MCE0733530.1 YchJ family protein [Halomonas sp. G15]